jgi:hypothetical protein
MGCSPLLLLLLTSAAAAAAHRCCSPLLLTAAAAAHRCCSPLLLLQALLSPLAGLPCLLLQSGADEAVPAALRDSGAVEVLGQRMLQVLQQQQQQQQLNPPPGSTTTATTTSSSRGEQVPLSGGLLSLQVLQGAGHACAQHEGAVCDAVGAFLDALNDALHSTDASTGGGAACGAD